MKSFKRPVALVSAQGTILETYESVSAAARAFFISKASMWKYLNTKKTTPRMVLYPYLLRYLEEVKQ